MGRRNDFTQRRKDAKNSFSSVSLRQNNEGRTMVDRTAELLRMPGRPSFCPHRSAVQSMSKNRIPVIRLIRGSNSFWLRPKAALGLSVVLPCHPWAYLSLRPKELKSRQEQTAGFPLPSCLPPRYDRGMKDRPSWPKVLIPAGLAGICLIVGWDLTWRTTVGTEFRYGAFIFSFVAAYWSCRMIWERLKKSPPDPP
jgi:hypothetical protein